MPQINPDQDPPIRLKAEVANKLMLENATAAKTQMLEFAAELIKEPPPGAVKLSSTERYMWFIQKLQEVYPGDPFGMEVEVVWLLTPDYMDMIKQGIAPPPRSRPFVNYFPNMIIGFEVWRREFARVHKAVMGNA